MLHTTKEGKKIPIACMKDSHLLAYLRLTFKRFREQYSDNKQLSFLTGFDRNEIQPSDFYQQTIRNNEYILEGLRRDSTRVKVLGILAESNPVFQTRERILPPKGYNIYPESVSMPKAKDEPFWTYKGNIIDINEEISTEMCDKLSGNISVEIERIADKVKNSKEMLSVINKLRERLDEYEDYYCP